MIFDPPFVQVLSVLEGALPFKCYPLFLYAQTVVCILQQYAYWGVKCPLMLLYRNASHISAIHANKVGTKSE